LQNIFESNMNLSPPWEMGRDFLLRKTLKLMSAAMGTYKMYIQCTYRFCDAQIGSHKDDPNRSLFLKHIFMEPCKKSAQPDIGKDFF
ncbi:hypothetical protein, partial [Escherichia coli]|uniref:hypothetical protein n=1 Tax=Escherichia coli TaxID=562 RepID=UPI001BFBF7CE